MNEVVENQGLISKVVHQKFVLYSAFLERTVSLEIIDNEPSGFQSRKGLLLVNDGQDLDKLSLIPAIDQLTRQNKLMPLKVVAITAGERKSEYGVAGVPDYLGRGARAGDYRNFIIHELLPWIFSTQKTYFPPQLTAFAGCSLGGLSALDIVSSSPGHFSMAGVFSGSLWWRSKGYGDGYTDKDRIILQKLSSLTLQNHFRCWLMAGTNDELNDRNSSGVIDAVEDTLDVYELLSGKMKKASQNLFLKIVNGGHHHPTTWANQFPEFLEATFGLSIK